MSNRFTGQNRNDYNYKNSPKPQKKFVPKRDSPNPNPHHTLSNSFRTAVATTTVSGSGGGAVVASTSRVGMGGDGKGVNSTTATGNFVIYLPQDEAVAAGLGPEEGGLDPMESQRVVDLLNLELSRLLKLHPRDFWKEVATNESLSSFLESFLKFRSRWYDFPHRGARGIVAGVIVGEFELCRRVFMVLYRLSSNRDPGVKNADTLSLKDHEALLQDKKLLDLPKLLDICAIYGHENEDLTRILVCSSKQIVKNAMRAQPFIHDDFPVLLSHLLSIIQTMYQRCSSSLEVLLSSAGNQDQGSSRLHLDYLEVMDFINDSVVSLDSFVTSYEHAAVFFSSPVEMSYGNEELLTTLARLHDSLIPSLQRGFRVILGVGEDRSKKIPNDLLSDVFSSLKMMSTRIAKLGWKLLYFCYLSDEAFENSYSLPISMKMFPANVEDPVVRADIIIQTIRDLTGDNTNVLGGRTWGTFIQNIENNHQMMSRMQLLQKTGWLSMDDEQLQFLSQIMKTPPHANVKETHPTSSPASNKVQADEDAAIIESKISQIKELFPDYGRGFLVACLEAYNHDPEEVIQRILEGTLHEELQSLDISLEKTPPPKQSSSLSSTIKPNDKGKGKLVVDSAISPPQVVKNQPLVSSVSSSSSSAVGRFVRKNTNDVSESETLNNKKEKELAKTAALSAQLLEYDDEYDDSFDDLGLSVGDSGMEEPETLGERMNSHRGGKSTEAEGGGSGSNAADSSKWGSRKKPQYYVKDGKNYSYKVDGATAVANYNEARLVNQVQKELVHGLGQGGNLPLGVVKRWTEKNEEQEEEGQENDEGGGRGGRGGGRGGGGRRGRGRNQYRKDRAMSKHFSGMPAHFNS
ncbi:hypothetical protein ABFS82_14G261500 [Erythranthe guttata]